MLITGTDEDNDKTLTTGRSVQATKKKGCLSYATSHRTRSYVAMYLAGSSQCSIEESIGALSAALNLIWKSVSSMNRRMIYDGDTVSVRVYVLFLCRSVAKGLRHYFSADLIHSKEMTPSVNWMRIFLAKIETGSGQWKLAYKEKGSAETVTQFLVYLELLLMPR